MGAALAQAALSLGAEVTVVSGPVSITYPRLARVIQVRSAEEMLEAAKAVAAYAFGASASRGRSRKQRDRATARLASSLATDERRRVVRASLAELAELSAEEFPLASLALRELLAEPVPDDPVKDELWVNLVVGLAHEQLDDALVDATVR